MLRRTPNPDRTRTGAKNTGCPSPWTPAATNRSSRPSRPPETGARSTVFPCPRTSSAIPTSRSCGPRRYRRREASDMRSRIRHAALIPLLFALGCGAGSTKTAEPSRPVPAGKQDTAQAEGVCKEHGVLEALCTRCNPKLAAVFQAKGDWCKEHGFPESVCPTCHPERGGKPAVDVASDEAPADGTKVRLRTGDTARLAGIETVRAVPGRGVSEIVAPAIIAYDSSRVAQVNARSPGVVKRLQVEVGVWIREGAPLAVIESASLSADQSRLDAVRSRVRVAEVNYRREEELERKGISSRKEVSAAEQEMKEAKAGSEALAASLAVVGADPGSRGRYVVTAPMSGIVTQRNVSPDRFVDSHCLL